MAEFVDGGGSKSVLENALKVGEGLSRLTPTWVPRFFLHPGKRIRLNPKHYFANDAERGGIDERWFASTTEFANVGRIRHEGLRFCSFDGNNFLLRDAVAEAGGEIENSRSEPWVGLRYCSLDTFDSDSAVGTYQLVI